VLGILYAILFYLATLILVIGLVARIRHYMRVPAPLKVPTTPAPRTRFGVILRVFREVAFFESLFKSNKWIWLFGFTFHISMWLVLARHLRYFTQPIWELVVLVQPFGTYAAYGMALGLAGLWGRRIFVERIRYISNPSDHLMLALLGGIVATGMLTRFVVHTNIIEVKVFFLGLMRFQIHDLPGDPIILTHLFLVAALMMVFPISKLLHAPGVFFSPSRNQIDNPRDQGAVRPLPHPAE